MNRRLMIRPEAAADIGDAASWYERERTGLAAEFLASLDSIFRAILQTPFAYPVILGATRRAMTFRFPFMVYFTLEGETIHVLAVLHGRRNPGEWHRRI